MTAIQQDIERINVVQGGYYVTNQPRLVLTTILGSCVAACLRDPESGVGGMNHFLLPGSIDDTSASQSESYGIHLMEVLVNGLLAIGARRNHLEAKLFGGAKMVKELPDVGNHNADFAKNFLTREGITFLGGSTQGFNGRRLDYWPVSGRARQRLIDESEVAPAPAKSTIAIDVGSGDVELF